jgi:hypothetical protein
MTLNQMNIREAARWADRKDALYINGNFENPLCAVYSTGNHMVSLIGSYDKCRAFIKANCGIAHIPMAGSCYETRDGEWIRFDPLETVCAEMSESEGEDRCIPDACEVCEWA